ncbi:MAG: metallophosphoesterase [Lentisphaeria bacterium]|nr:metallophosphoesterase [Lentisphaeria bacterium]
MNTVQLLSFGVMTDNHLDPALPELAERTLAAFRLFRELEPDLLIDCGDITDFWQPGELKHFGKMFRETFAGKAPETLWLLAGHDVTRHPDYWGAYPEGMALIGTEDTIPVRRVNGIYFVGLFQNGNYQEFEKRLTKAIAASPGRPVFAVTHEPAYGTVLNSDYNGDRELLEIFRKYPSVIQVSGHTHTPIFHDRNIWQGEFTAFNAGSLTYWKDITRGRESRRHKSFDALFCRLHADRLEIKRLNVMTRKEVAPDWVIPLPFDAASAPYAPERRAEELPVPNFRTAPAVRFSDGKFGVLTIENAEPFAALQRYRVTLFETEQELSVMDYYPGTWPETVRGKAEDFLLPPGMLKTGCSYRCRIVPMNQFDREGEAAETCFTAPDTHLAELPVRGIGGVFAGDAKIPVRSDGTFEVDALYPHGYRIMPPRELTVYYTRPVVMVFDFSCSHTGRPAVLMACGEKPDYGRHFLPPGVEKKHRHCFDLSALKGDCRFLLLCEGEAGKYRIENIRYFTYPA